MNESESEVSQSGPTLCDPMDCSPSRFLCLWDFPGKNTGVVCHFRLQGNDIVCIILIFNSFVIFDLIMADFGKLGSLFFGYASQLVGS